MTSDLTASSTELEDLLRAPAHLRLRHEMALVDELVDVPYYALTNREVLEPQIDPVEHFCREGWTELRKPNRDFDVWWYWANHMDPADDSLNPLVHYALVGRDKGLSTRPDSTIARPAQALTKDRPIRRASLVAGFDAQGLVDPAVIALITELGRHSDVFYLSDGYLSPDELAKLEGITEGAWAVRHGAYDFGSYSKLASEFVGWDRLQEYDEVVLVNDSCFVLRPLDEVFSTMAERECDWWGLQATKGMADSAGLNSGRIQQPVPIDTVRSEMLELFEQDPVYTFHVGSYFMVFRRPVVESAIFRRFLDSVVSQESKRAIVVKYEMGLTHLLIGHGFAFDTYIDTLYPFHPMFSDWYFTMVEQGFPLLKRFLIYRNHYDVPGLAQWKERIGQLVPGADVDLFEQTLLRAAPDDELQRSYSITKADNGRVKVPRVLEGTTFRQRNKKAPKRPDWWAFPVDRVTHEFPDNSRAIFEEIKDDPRITKIILTRSRRVRLPGANVIAEPLLSVAGRDRLMQSGRVFMTSNVRRSVDGGIRSSPEQRLIFVRHGLQLEGTGRVANDPSGPSQRIPAGRSLPSYHPTPPVAIDGLLVASDVDQLATLATHWPARFENVWRTGIPAHDFLQKEEEQLPEDLQQQIAGIRAQLRGRRLLLFAPTRRVRGVGRAPYGFSDLEVARVRAWCERNDFVLGIREHILDVERAYAVDFAGSAIDVSPGRYPSVHAVMRAADAMLTDYDGAALDFATTGKPVISFAHDLEVAQDRLLYDLGHFFPGPVCRDFASLESTLDFFVDTPDVPRHARVREMLIDHHDGHNTERALARLAALEGDESL